MGQLELKRVHCLMFNLGGSWAAGLGWAGLGYVGWLGWAGWAGLGWAALSCEIQPKVAKIKPHYHSFTAAASSLFGVASWAAPRGDRAAQWECCRQQCTVGMLQV